MEYKYQGIILGKKDVGETDRIYTIYTLEKGKIRVLAKGVRKPNARLAGALETVTKGEFFIAKNRGLGKITGAIVDGNYPNIKNDLGLIANIFFIFRIISQVISEEEQDEEMFSLLEKYLSVMDGLPGKQQLQEILTAGFLFKMMDMLGYHMEVDRCVRCEKKLILERNYLSISRGGILCSECQKSEARKIAVSNEMIKLMRIFSTNKLESLMKLKADMKDIQRLKGIAKEIIIWFSGESMRI